MASSNVTTVVNHFPTANEGFITTLDSTISAGDTEVPLTSTSGLTNGTVFVGIIEPGTVGKEQTFTGTVDTGGNQITGVKWTRGTNTGHNAGVTIVDYVSGTVQNMMTKGWQVEHKQDGTHDDVTTTSISNTGTLAQTGVASFSDNLDVVDGKAIRDGNDNELVKFSQTASAVNEYTVKNAATGNAPQLQATGGDTNIGINLVPKGTGEVQFNGVAVSGAYTDFSSSVTFTNLTKGSGTVAAYYKQVGKRVHYYGKLTFAADTTMGTDPQINVPVNFASTVSDNQPIGSILMLDASGPTYHGGDAMKTSAANRVFFLRRVVSGASVLASGLTLSTPFGANWTTSDVLWWNITYECA